MVGPELVMVIAILFGTDGVKNFQKRNRKRSGRNNYEPRASTE